MYDQGALFDLPPAAPRPRKRAARPEPEPIEWPNGIRPWDPIDERDAELGWQYRGITPTRARQIRRQIQREEMPGGLMERREHQGVACAACRGARP
jgi:hypothetical protein